MEPFGFRHSISRRLIIYVVLFSSLVTLLLTALQMYLEYTKDVSLIEERIQQIQDTSLQSLTANLWNVYKTQLQIQLEGLLQLPDMQYIEVRSKDDTVFVSVGTSKSENIISQQFPMIYIRQNESFVLGKLVVVASLEQVYQRLINRVLIILASNAVKTFLVSIFIFVFFQLLITRYLVKISQHTQKLDFKDLGVPLTLNRRNRLDELQQLVTAINNMQINLGNSYKELDQYKVHLEEKVKKRTAELKTSEAQNTAILEALPDLMFRLSREGEYLDFKAEQVEDLVAAPDQIIGSKLSDQFPPDFVKECLYFIDKALETGTIQTFEYQLPLPKGVQDFEARLVVSGPNEVLWIVRNITELKNMQAQLIQSAKLASLGEMATGIAHELNQPLAIISMSAEMVSEDLENGEVKSELELILKQVDRAATIIDHLKLFGRDTRQLQRIKTDINQIINDSFILISEQLRFRGVEVVKDLSEDLPPVYCNALRIEQVVTNLLTNARDALERSKDKRLMVRSFQRGQGVVIEIEDTGAGIPQKFLNQIFDPFFTTKEVGKGTGLGLSISYSIIQEHGGNLTVTSEEGKGTLFKIELPEA